MGPLDRDLQQAVEPHDGVIEVLNRSGQVQQRILVGHGQLTVGRGYDNDIIVDDPYVCPHHLELEVEQQGLSVRDLDTVNGTWLRGGKQKVQTASMADSELLQIGHSQLRYRSVTAQVPPALKDATSRGFLALFRTGWVLVLGVLLTLAGLVLTNYLDDTRQLGPGLVASKLTYPLFGLFLWAGIWSIINRVASHRANFRAHLAIAAWALAGLFATAQGVPMIAFAFDWGGMVEWMKLLTSILVVSLALFAHMQFLVHGNTLRQALGAGLLAAILIGSPAMGDWLRQDEFSSLPRLSPLLKPPGVKQVEGVSVEAYFEQAESLKRRIDLDRDSGS